MSWSLYILAGWPVDGLHNGAVVVFVVVDVGAVLANIERREMTVEERG